jgi:hypothetical protein
VKGGDARLDQEDAARLNVQDLELDRLRPDLLDPLPHRLDGGAALHDLGVGRERHPVLRVHGSDTGDVPLCERIGELLSELLDAGAVRVGRRRPGEGGGGDREDGEGGDRGESRGAAHESS